MRYIIYGAGGVGGVLGAKLFLAGIDVVLIARGEHLAKIRRDGLVLNHLGVALTLPIPAVGRPGDIEFRPGDAVLLTMKSQDTQAALDELRAAAGDQISVFCCQNGVENERAALRRFAKVYGVLVIIGTTYLEPGVVETTAWEVAGVFDVGRYPQGLDDVAESVAADFRRAGLASEANARIMRLKYAKLLRINLVNALQALIDPAVNTDDILADLTAEAEACFAAAGIDYATGEEFAARVGAMGRRVPGIASAGWRGGSTWQGLVRGSPTTETDYLNGEVVLLGRLHGVPTPANEVMALYVDRMAREGLRPGSVDIEELRRGIAMREQATAGS